jgi:hypothetical protein
MKLHWRYLSLWSLAALMAAGRPGCGDSSAAPGGTQVATAGGGPTPAGSADCLPATEVTLRSGLPVRLVQAVGDPAAGWHTCLYQVEQRQDIFIELTTAPAAAADTVFAGIKTHAKGQLGQEAEADKVTVGEGGWAYSSTSLCEAATLAGGRLYRAKMEHWGETETPGAKGAMVELLARMVR